MRDIPMLRQTDSFVRKFADTMSRMSMMPPKKEIALALLVVGFVWLALFAHWVPVTLQSVLFVGLLILGFTMIVAGWWRWRGVMREENTASWPKKMGLLGLVANTLALAVPFIVFFYAVASFGHRQQRNDWLVVFPTCLAFSLCGLICGVVAPPRIRFATAMGGLVVGSIILSIPIGIL